MDQLVPAGLPLAPAAVKVAPLRATVEAEPKFAPANWESPQTEDIIVFKLLTQESDFVHELEGLCHLPALVVVMRHCRQQHIFEIGIGSFSTEPNNFGDQGSISAI